MLGGSFLLLLLAALASAHIKHSHYKMARDTLFVGWDSNEEGKPERWTNIEECEQAREQCYRMQDCKDDWACLGELRHEPTTAEHRLDLVDDDHPDHSHDLHPCVQLVHYCYGIDKELFRRVINQRIYWQYQFEHNLNHA